MQSCRKALDSLKLEKGENASLIMARYIKNLDDKNESKRKLFSAMSHAALNALELYKHAFRMRRDTLAMKAMPKTFRTIQPLAVGLGNSNVIETGLALNPLYGMPMLPGSSIKGITAHYCSEIFGAENHDYRGPDPDAPLESAGRIYEALFGKVAPEKEQEAGLLRFYDAWIMPESVSECFVMDVMTPHYGSDFADPNPINFLTVEGEFEIFIGCGNPEADKRWIDFAFSLTEAALNNYGIGGKIRAGYGKMECVLSPDEKKAREDEAIRAKFREKGFMFIEGDEIDVVCVKIEVNKKGKEKQTFVLKEDCGDRNTIHFNPKIKVSEGEPVKGRIKKIEEANHTYILEKI